MYIPCYWWGATVSVEKISIYSCIKTIFLFQISIAFLVIKKPRQYYKLRLNGFSRKKTLNRRVKLCSKNKPQKTSVPIDRALRFKNLSKLFRHPFIVYADFECLIVKIHSATPSSEYSFAEWIEKLRPISYAIIAFNVKSDIIFQEYFVGENAVHFFNTLKTVTNKLFQKWKSYLWEQAEVMTRNHACFAENHSLQKMLKRDITNIMSEAEKS